MVKRLTINNEKTFFSSVEKGDIFIYSFSRFTWKDVEKLALKNGVRIKYNDSETEEYKQYGDTCGTVI